MLTTAADVTAAMAKVTKTGEKNFMVNMRCEEEGDIIYVLCASMREGENLMQDTAAEEVTFIPCVDSISGENE